MPREIMNKMCPICGSALLQRMPSEQVVCSYCGTQREEQLLCPKGHVLCQECRDKDPMSVITALVRTTIATDPGDLAELMMGVPNLPMLGCEHAFIAAGSLMAAIRNSPYGRGKITNEDLQAVLDRTAKQATDGHCALTGVCGIAPALGACVSVFLGARWGSDTEQKITMEAVLRVMQAVTGMTGPACCKAYVRTGLKASVAFFGERFGILLPFNETTIVCDHSAQHPHGCPEERCPYYRKPAADIFADSMQLPKTACRS